MQMSAHKKEQLGFWYTYMLCHNFIAIGKTQWLLVIYLSLRMAFELILPSFLLFGSKIHNATKWHCQKYLIFPSESI